MFDGVGPDYVKTESINGVRTPSYMPTADGGCHIKDLPDGFKIVKYPSSALGSADADGIRPVKPDALPSSVTIYRNPDGGTATSSGNMDVVHKQHHPQSGAWVTRTIRFHAPQNNNNWTTKFYLGDPAQNSTLTPYREITITRTPNPDGTETTHEVTEDRDSSGNLVVTSDLTRTYAFYKHGEPVILSETSHTGTGSELTTTWTYSHNSADQGSFNKPATMRRSDGQWSNTTYQGNPVTGTLVTKTVSGWLDNPAPPIHVTFSSENPVTPAELTALEAANRVVTEFEAKNETGTIGREEKIQGVIVSRTWGDRYKANSGELIEKSNEQRGTATLTTIRTGYPDDASSSEVERGRLKSIQHPDGTVALHRHTMQGENRIETIDSGVGSLSAVTDGTRTVSTYTKDDVLIKQVTSDIASGIELAARQAIAFDSNDQPTRWAYDNNLENFSETLNGCCGIDSERNRNGVLTTYTRDGLKRPKTATSQGITLTYTYGSKTIGANTFPSTQVTQSSGSLTFDQGTTVYDHAGNVIQQITPDLDGDGNPEITTMARDYAARTTTTTHANGGTSITTEHADGQSLSTTGTAVPDSSQSTTVGNNLDGISGAVTKTTQIRPSGTAAGDQITTSYQAVGGLTLITQLNGTTTATYTYDSLARPILVTDGDGVKQHTAYNTKGEAYRHATSRDGNNTIDPGTDTVSESLSDITDIPGFGPAIRRISKIWTDANTAVVTSTTLQSPDGTKSSTTTLGVANPSSSQSASALDRTDGSWTDTQTNPDGTKQVTTYENWLPITQSSYSSLPSSSLLSSVSSSYDSLRRPITQTDSRTGAVTTNYSPTHGQVTSIDDHDRVTSFKYDNMGRRVETTLPDSSKTYTTYWPDGQVKASYGSQTNPTVKLYTEQGQLVELRTFRSSNLTLAPDETTTNFDATTWEYHPNGQLKQKHDAAGKGATYTYTPAGRLATRTWARGIVTTYGYTHGLLTTTDYSDNTPDVVVTYDSLGRQTTVSSLLSSVSQSSVSYSYDPATLALDTETISYDLNTDGTADFTRVINRSRDALGRSTGYTLQGSAGVPPASFTDAQATYGYSPATGRLETITDGTSAFRYDYLANSSLIESVTATAGAVHTVINAWEPNRNVLASKQNKVGTSDSETQISKARHPL